MKISNHLPHFSESSLLVSAGKQEATFFLVEGDQVTQIHNFKINKPEYTDKESRTERRGSGGSSMFGGGSSFTNQADELERSFIKKLSVTISNLVDEHKIKTIYLFCPTYQSKPIESSLSLELQNIIEYIFYGNYHSQHPFVLLSKVQEYLKQEKDAGTVVPMKKEAFSILKNTNGLSGLQNGAV